MSRTTHDRFDPCAEHTNGHGCPRPALEKLRFWNGRFLVARDLRDQQDDLIRRLEYHQHFAHGEGILCGFTVRKHPRDDCQGNWLVIESGMGYDCCGRTLWSPEARAVEFPAPPNQESEGHEDEEEAPESPVQTKPESRTEQPDERRRDEWEREQHDPERREPYRSEQQRRPPYEPEREPPEPEEVRPPQPQWFVLVCHEECPTDPVPALYAEDLCNPIRHEHGRVREGVVFKVVPAAEISEECWPRRRPLVPWDCSEPYEDDCHQHFGDSPPCDLRCACGECLVLAAVWRDPRTGQLRWSGEHRKVLGQAGNLTRITGVSWPHGGELSTEQLIHDHDGSLLVRFSRRLRPPEGLKNGINPMTFTVSFLGPTRNYEQIMPSEEGEHPGRPATPRLSDNGRCAIFDLERDMLTGRMGYGGTYLHIRLLCDFLVDCHGRSVSGAHLAGEVDGRGSGNTVQGGVFESWFYLRSAGRGGRR